MEIDLTVLYGAILYSAVLTVWHGTVLLYHAMHPEGPSLGLLRVL